MNNFVIMEKVIMEYRVLEEGKFDLGVNLRFEGTCFLGILSLANRDGSLHDSDPDKDTGKLLESIMKIQCMFGYVPIY